MASIGERTIFAITLTAIMIASVVFNIFFIFTFAKVKRIRKAPSNYFLLMVSIADLTAGVVWCLPSLLAVCAPGWLLGTFMCSVVGTFWTLCYVINMHVLGLLGVERCFRICRPSKHEIIFTPTTSFILLTAVLLFDLVMAFFPAMGWGTIAYFSSQFQCIPAFEKSESHLNFMFIFSYILPVILNIICFSLIMIKVHKLKSKVDPGKTIILEENKDIPKESYAEKLQKKRKIHKMEKTEKGKNILIHKT